MNGRHAELAWPSHRRLIVALLLLATASGATGRARNLESSGPSLLRLALWTESTETTNAASEAVFAPMTNCVLSVSRDESVLQIPRAIGLWSVEFGVAIISDDTPADYLHGNFRELDGPGAGLTYNFTIARRLKQYDWKIGRMHLHPQWELPFMLTLVDDHVQGVIPDVNLGFRFRWTDFPWNRYLPSTFAIGGGLSYSFQIWTADIQRHPGDYRSKLKFWLPIEFTVALPQWPCYQVTAFIDHQSGGRLLDRGGVDAWGLGLRFVY